MAIFILINLNSNGCVFVGVVIIATASNNGKANEN